MPVALPEDLVEFLESGVSMILATRDAELRPEVLRGLGALVAADRQSITLFLNAALSARTLDNIRANGRIAVAFSRIHDHRTVQLKGRVLEVRDVTPQQQPELERYRVAFAEQVAMTGLPRSVTRRMRISPSVALSIEFDEGFDQTPGPAAGRPMEPA
ncbi:MAG: pyridoxamine 5'-phosphate oxidase family protein [Polyangiaceae bacterium]|nr:pyridoxamine 5'-phosphate oxidase family protein [Myxococcales bacterium]MCB9585958.1 pyridoxamine 5'-phosphate oxidase family protein [Polyangiaceae bacterium]MCB9607112.1 pyridoxamine 5'-phosphate oxidase family protein [Polyangiaceae bacterium]